MKSKGELYSKVFRKAGMAWGKGDVYKAIAILQEGLVLACKRGDTDIVQVLQADLQRYQRVAASGEMDLGR